MDRCTSKTLMAAVALTAVLLPSPASAAGVVNGDFESGDLTGWDTAAYYGGTWSAWDGVAGTCTGAPAVVLDGTYSALADQPPTPASEFLVQTFKIPRSAHRLKFRYAYASGSGIVAPNSLQLDVPNQQFRADILAPNADAATMSRRKIWGKVIATKAGAPTTHLATTARYDLSDLAGKQVRIRFVVVANQSCFNVWLDDVKVK